jgi:signal recognition particle subunit SRP9
MVYLDDIDEFAAGSKALFEAAPDRTRCLMKYRHEDQQLSVKVTDDVHCLKFKTKDQADMKKVERIMTIFLRWSLSNNTDAESLAAAIDNGDDEYKQEMEDEKERKIAKNQANQNKNKKKGKR